MNHKSVQHAFEWLAVRQRDSVAVELDSSTLTYGELNARANALARLLMRRGVVPGSYVPIALDHSFELVVAILGVLKAGGAYAPLDLSYPPSRLTLMLEDLAPRLIIADDAATDRLRDCDLRAQDLLLTNDREAQCALRGESTGADDPDPDTNVSPDELAWPSGTSGASAAQPAYVMFTSGSTGRPKGAVIPHRAILRLVQGADFADMGANEVWLQLAPISFDASTLELWAPLLNGGRCVLHPERVPSLDRLERTIAEHGVTSLWLTSSLFNLVIDQAPQALRPVRQVLTGGEALSVPHVARAIERLPDTRLINGYGPTENTTFTCCYTIPHDRDVNGRTHVAAWRSIPIGTPIHGTTAHILNEAQEPVPEGDVGELYCGGAGVALGYLNRPELTRERFVPDQFAEERTAVQGGDSDVPLLYRTGDLVRRRPEDGLIEFLGRADRQVKIRGFRIELTEIEQVLLEHPEVQQVAVTVDPPLDRTTGEAGDRRLVAYIVSQSSTADCPQMRGPVRDARMPDGLRAFVQDRLPSYMTPAAWIALERLPLDPNGKLDQRSLPVPPQPGSNRDAPATQSSNRRTVFDEGSGGTPLVRALRDLFVDILKVDRVRPDDDFFALGGHSVLAIRLALEIRTRFGVPLDVTDVLAHPSILALADLIARRHPEAEVEARSGENRAVASTTAPAAASCPCHERPSDSDGPMRFELSAGQLRILFEHDFHPEVPLHHEPLAMRIGGPIHQRALRCAFDEVNARHPLLRSRIVRDLENLCELDAGLHGIILAPDASPAPFDVVRLDCDTSPVASGKEVRDQDEELRAAVESMLGRVPAVRVPPVVTNASLPSNLHVRVREVVEQPFDLQCDAPWRARLIVEADGRSSVLVMVFHHHVIDEWSQHLLLRTLEEAYRRAIGSAPEPAVNHDDEADAPAPATDPLQAGERDRVLATALSRRGDAPHVADLAHGERFWKESLTGTNLHLPLPRRSDRPTQGASPAVGATYAFRMPNEVGRAWRAIARAHGITPFALGLTSWARTLAGAADTTDLTILTPIALREDPRLAEAVGFFLNSLPVRLRLRPAAPPENDLDEVRRTLLACFRHRQVPLQRIVQVAGLQVDRSDRGSGLFPVAFVMQHDPPTTVNLPGCEVTPLTDVHSGTSKFDLTLFLQDLGEGDFRGIIEYRSDQFDASWIRTLAEQLVTEAAAFDEQATITMSSPTTAAEQPSAAPQRATEGLPQTETKIEPESSDAIRARSSWVPLVDISPEEEAGAHPHAAGGTVAGEEQTGLLRGPKAEGDDDPDAPFALNASVDRLVSAHVRLYLVRVWQELLNLPTIGVDEDFFAVGGHSILAIRMFARIERDLGYRVPVSALFRAPTIRTLTDALLAHGNTIARSPLVHLSRHPAAPTLYCLPGGGGHVFMFLDFARMLGDAASVVGVQLQELPFSDPTQGGPDSIEAIADRIASLIREDRVQQDGIGAEPPLILCGYSLGGMLAYEVAGRLTEEGRAVGPLLMFDAFAPGALKPRSRSERFRVHLQHLKSLPWDERWRYLARRAPLLRHRQAPRNATAIGQVPPLNTSASSSTVLPVEPGTATLEERIEACNRRVRTMAERFHPPSYDVHITLIRAARHPDWFQFTTLTADNGWSAFVPRDRIEVTDIDCAHREMFRQPHLDAIVEHVGSFLNRAQSAARRSTRGVDRAT